jgi:hypothetical protein
MTHIIRRHFLHVEVNGKESDGLALQRRLPGLCEHRLTAALEQTLDRCAPHDGHLFIERLEIDAGAMVLERLEQDLAGAVAHSLETALHDKIVSATLTASDKNGSARQKTRRGTVNEAFLHFLETGTLPWWFRLPRGTNLEQAVRDSLGESEGDAGPDDADIRPVLRALARATVRKRLVRQFSARFLEALLAALSWQGMAALNGVVRTLRNSGAPADAARLFEQALWEAAFAKAATGAATTREDLDSEARSELRVTEKGRAVLTRMAKQPWPDTSDRVPAPAERHVAKHYTAEEAFIHFLKNGRLPRSFRLPPGTTLEQALLDAWQEEAEPGRDRRHLYDALQCGLASASVRKRLVRRFSSRFPGTLLRLLNPDGDTVTVDAFQATLSQDDSRSTTKLDDQSLWERVFARLAEADVPRSTEPLRKGRRASSPAAAEAVGEAVMVVRDPMGTNDGVPSGPNRPADSAPKAAECTVPRPSRPSLSGVKADDDTEHPDAVEGIYIEDAGLVLLHPFLAQLFEALDMAAGDELLHAERALRLLHYLATGRPSAPEYELILPKILCNVPLTEPVESDAALTDAEREEAAALLEAVIRHWGVLRNTSPDALRGTFLLRNGKVSLRDDDWLLQVESNTWDILLDQLPWGISMVKLPWMERMLWVEWR